MLADYIVEELKKKLLLKTNTSEMDVLKYIKSRCTSGILVKMELVVTKDLLETVTPIWNCLIPENLEPLVSYSLASMPIENIKSTMVTIFELIKSLIV